MENPTVHNSGKNEKNNPSIAKERDKVARIVLSPT